MSIHPVATPPPADETTWGDRLRRIRLNRRMDQREFAAAIGVKPATVGNYETSDHEPRTSALVANTIELRFGPAAAEFLRGPQPTDYGFRRGHLYLVPQPNDLARTG